MAMWILLNRKMTTTGTVFDLAIVFLKWYFNSPQVIFTTFLSFLFGFKKINYKTIQIKKPFSDCSANKIYQTCGGCTRTCFQRNLPCPAVCRQGCFCPPNHFLLGARCVPASQCPSTVKPRTTTRATTTPEVITVNTPA